MQTNGADESSNCEVTVGITSSGVIRNEAQPREVVSANMWFTMLQKDVFKIQAGHV